MNSTYKNPELESNIKYYQDKISNKILEKHEFTPQEFGLLFEWWTCIHLTQSEQKVFKVLDDIDGDFKEKKFVGKNRGISV